MIKNSKEGIKIPLVIYDLLIFLIVDAILFVVYQGAGELNPTGVLIQSSIALIVIFGARFLGKIYRQIWRYGGILAVRWNPVLHEVACSRRNSILYLSDY